MVTHAKRTNRLFFLGILLAGMCALASRASAVEIGDKAPDFLLPSTTGDTISLSQFHGKKYVLIEFYTGDFDPT